MEENKIFKVIAATGIPMLDDELKRQNSLNVTQCVLKNELEQLIERVNPQIVILTDKISGEESIIKLMIRLKNKFHYVRFIYLAGSMDPKDKARVDALGMLVLVGIYDIVISQKINIDLVMDIIKYPKQEQAVAYLTGHLLDAKHEITNAFSGLEYEEFSDNEVETSFPNVFTVASVKPGTGKSFLSVNLACAIAKYGVDKPKVALIEADMQTLSVGTLLSIDEKKGNLKTAMESVATLFNNNTLTDDMEKRRRTNKIIKNSMVTYKGLTNLDVLVGSSITPEEVDSLKIIPQYFTYIIEVLKEEYDYVIVDTNSSIFHVSSFPILQKAKACFYILNLDFNNVRNNVRYSAMLKELGIFQKVHYVLNENIENTKEFYNQGVNIEELNFTAEDIQDKYFKLEAKIPMLPKTVFLNRLYDGTPVVLDSDKIEATQKTKLEILKIANGICPIESEIEKLTQIIKKREEGAGGFFSRLFKKKEKTEAKENPDENK